MRVGLGALVMLLALSLPMAAFAKASSSITVDGITVRLQSGVCDLTGNMEPDIAGLLEPGNVSRGDPMLCECFAAPWGLAVPTSLLITF